MKKLLTFMTVFSILHKIFSKIEDNVCLREHINRTFLINFSNSICCFAKKKKNSL